MVKRLDLLLVQRGLFSSRNKAQSAIRKGEVTVGEEIIKTPSAKVRIDVDIKVAPQPPYPGRGGIKLSGALDGFGFDAEGMVVLDGGASTGGFTACLLERGARKIYAFDVGKDQIDQGLKEDKRVIVYENFNLRSFSPDIIEEDLDLVVLDLSFISATMVIAPLVKGLKDGGFFLTLVKPQFEVGPEKVGKKGLVRNEQDQLRAVIKVAECKEKEGLGLIGVLPSCLPGVSGNKEYFLLAQKGRKGEINSKSLFDLGISG